MKENITSENQGNERTQSSVFLDITQSELSRFYMYYLPQKIVFINPHPEQDNIRPHEQHNKLNLSEVQKSLYTQNWFGKPIAAFGINKSLFQNIPNGFSYLPNSPDNKLIIADGTHRLKSSQLVNARVEKEHIYNYLYPYIPVQVFPDDKTLIQIGSWNNQSTYSISDIIENVIKGTLMLPKETKFMIKFPSQVSNISADNFIDENESHPLKLDHIPSNSLLRIRSVQPNIFISRDQMIALDQCIRLITRMMKPGFSKAIPLGKID